MIATIIDLYSFVVLAAVVVSWVPVDPRNRLAAVIRGATEPVLEPIRRVLPSISGIDLSPMVLLVALQLLKGLL